MTSSWSAPDPRRAVATVPVFGVPPDTTIEDVPVGAEVRAGLVAAVASVLAGRGARGGPPSR